MEYYLAQHSWNWFAFYFPFLCGILWLMVVSLCHKLTTESIGDSIELSSNEADRKFAKPIARFVKWVVYVSLVGLWTQVRVILKLSSTR